MVSKEEKMFKHANGVYHKYKLKSSHKTKSVAKREAKKLKDEFYYIRVIPAKKKGKRIFKVFAFALWD